MKGAVKEIYIFYSQAFLFWVHVCVWSGADTLFKKYKFKCVCDLSACGGEESSGKHKSFTRKLKIVKCFKDKFYLAMNEHE